MKQQIIEQIRTVHDPEIPVNVYDMGLIYRLELTESESGAPDCVIDMTLTTPACPVAGAMPGMVKEAAARVQGLADVTVNLVWDPPWTAARMSEAAKLELNMF
ncbi:MAG: DUF59 domain-containing protein [Alphaproteobacteria bacterium]|nr:DUF59 domain-containing protein [Alphaproteobacteria bacterium]